MSIIEAVSASARGFGARVRRDAIVYLICAVCAVTAFVLALWASILALVPLVGPVYALLILAGGFLAILGATLLWQHYANAPAPAAAPQPGASTQSAQQAMQRQTQFAQIAMIVEAVLLGYSLSRRRR